MNIKCFQKQGFFIKKQNLIKSNKHIFCGDHDIYGAFCPNCNKKLLLFLSINTEDSNLVGIKNFNLKLINFLFCWTCNISQDHFFYKLIDDKKIKIIKYKNGGKMTDFPYKKYPIFFPKANVYLDKISKRDQNIIINVNNGKIDEFDLDDKDAKICEPKHQIGGIPYLVQREFQEIKCCECNNKMVFIVNICDKCEDPRGFVGNDYVQVIYYLCAKCFIICATQQCD